MPPELERCVASFMQDEANVKRWPDPDVRKSHAFAICTARLKKGGVMDEPHFGYISLTETMQFDADNVKASWIQAFPLGKWKHPVYGAIEMTKERVARFVKNLNDKITDNQLHVDFRHKRDPAKGGEAAGWIAMAEDRGDDGLWINIEWTDDAAKEIKERKWKYFSPEYADDWENNKGDKFQDVLLGGAVTNQPFLREIQPINLEEVIKVQDYLNEYLHALEEDGVKLSDVLDEAALKYLGIKPIDPPTPVLFEEEIKAGLYLEGIELRDIPQDEREKHSAADFAGKGKSFPIFSAEDVTAAAKSLGRAGPDNYPSDQIKANIIRIAYRKGSAFVSKLPDAWKKKAAEEVNMELVKQLQETLGLNNADEDTLVARIGELSDYFEKKSSDEEKAKRFEDDYPEEFKRLNSLEKTRKLEVTKARISEWAGKGLPAVVHDRIKELRSSLSDDDAKKFDEVIGGITKVGLVKLTENGASHGLDTELEGSVEGEIQRLMSEDKELSRKDATKKVFEEHKDWATEYAQKGGGE